MLTSIPCLTPRRGNLTPNSVVSHYKYDKQVERSGTVDFTKLGTRGNSRGGATPCREELSPRSRQQLEALLLFFLTVQKVWAWLAAAISHASQGFPTRFKFSEINSIVADSCLNPGPFFLLLFFFTCPVGFTTQSGLSEGLKLANG